MFPLFSLLLVIKIVEGVEEEEEKREREEEEEGILQRYILIRTTRLNQWKR